ncbi:MAG TPA: hypothetical protein ACFYD6_04765 [Candidatus Brocadiia bacterium]|nr:hypothetical protein [Planctomycetota bacterium]MBI4007675.1 hypothetical protein [Planctomycetota bacterium]MDO8093870.1 hypothetical protein [Candidatus Brocadiales bacterium]
MKRFYYIIKSQKIGIITGFSVTGLLIIGSLLMNFFPEAYQDLSGEDISFFFSPAKSIHIWFYVMFFGFIVYGVNAFFCTLDSVTKKIKGGVKKASLYGASVLHVGFLITLLAHLVGGFGAWMEKPITVTGEWAKSGNMEMKITSLKTISYPNGMPKKVEITMKVKRDGQEINDILGYNQPVTLDYGTREILLRDYGTIPLGITLKVDDTLHELKMYDTIRVNGAEVMLTDLHLPPSQRYPVVSLVNTPQDGAPQQVSLRIGEANSKTINGSKVVFADIRTTPGALVSIKENPSIPITLGSIILFSIGTILVVMRIVEKAVSAP